MTQSARWTHSFKFHGAYTLIYLSRKKKKKVMLFCSINMNHLHTLGHFHTWQQTAVGYQQRNIWRFSDTLAEVWGSLYFCNKILHPLSQKALWFINSRNTMVTEGLTSQPRPATSLVHCRSLLSFLHFQLRHKNVTSPPKKQVNSNKPVNLIRASERKHDKFS